MEKEKIYIKLPLPTWKEEKLEPLYKSIQSAAELGFMFKATLKDLVKANITRGSFWGAYVNEELVGAAIVGSRALYQHMARHGDINVYPEHRRNRYGTCLYVIQIMQAILEGRRCVEDTIVPALSPWMAGATPEGGGFLHALGYTFYGTLPERTRSFKDIQLWGNTVDNFQKYLDRLPTDREISFELRDTPAMRQTFSTNMEVYSKNRPELIETMNFLRGVVYSIADVLVISDEEQVKDKGGNWVDVKE